jgi:para-nitrobenzyl esterase
MIKNVLAVFLFAFALSNLNLNAQAQCPAGRYHDHIFSSQSQTGIAYGSAVKYDGTVQNLSMDIWQPKNDNFAHRPLIILAFGGSFTSGLKESPDLLYLCDDFAKRGFVTASIDYRIGKENGDDTSMYKAVIRGLQDMGGALRFFYQDAQTTNTYRIDTNQIWIGGTSAGAFIGLNRGYFNLISSRPMPPGMVDIIVNMGGIDGGNTAAPGYHSKIKGVVDLCGAILDTIWIQANGPLLVGVHGTADNTVPFYYDSIKGITDIKARFFGSGDIINRANHVGLNYSIYPMIGADHAPFVIPSTPYLPPSSLYMDTTVQVLRDFLYTNTVCDPTLVSGINPVEEDNVKYSLMPNPSTSAMDFTSQYAGTFTAEIYSTDGKLAATKVIAPNATVKLTKEELGPGMFLMVLRDKAAPSVLKVEKIIFY